MTRTHDTIGMARIASASDIPIMLGKEPGFVHYDKLTGHKGVITLREKEERALAWRKSIEVTDGDLEVFKLHDGKIDPPLDMAGQVQWAPTSSHPQLMGSPVKYMAEGSAAASSEYGLTSPQWPGKFTLRLLPKTPCNSDYTGILTRPHLISYFYLFTGYNTGKRTEEWVARQRREVRIEKFSNVEGRQVTHSQNAAIASYANLTEYLIKETLNSQEYRAVTAQMEELDLVIMVSVMFLVSLYVLSLDNRPGAELILLLFLSLFSYA